MDIKLFLDPVESECVASDASSSSFQESIFINHTKMYELDGVDIVLLGVLDVRSEGATESSLVAFRKALYSLAKNTGTNRILDLGNLRNGPSPADTRLRLMEVCEHLLSRNILPIIIGGSHDMDIGQYRAYEAADKLVTLLNVDGYFDLDERSDVKGHIAQIIKHDPNYLFNYIHLAFQSYLVDSSQLGVLEELYFEVVRLGDIKGKVAEYEPYIRDADLMSFDLSAVQSIYCPGTFEPNVFGLTGEEAAQICWYAGHNDKLTSLGIYGYNAATDHPDGKTAQVVAAMVWYFIEGYYHRKGDKNFMSNDYTIYEVAFENRPETVRFYKSKMSDKWWLEVPDENSDSIFLRNRMIPCSYTDYETAMKGELPARWLKAMSAN